MNTYLKIFYVKFEIISFKTAWPGVAYRRDRKCLSYLSNTLRSGCVTIVHYHSSGRVWQAAEKVSNTQTNHVVYEGKIR